MKFGIIKYLVQLLMLIIAISCLFAFMPAISTWLIVQSCLFVVYFFLALWEYVTVFKPEKLPKERFQYLPGGIVSKKTIFLSALLLSFICLVLISGRLFFLAIIVGAMLWTELFLFILRWQQKKYFLALFNDHIYFCQETNFALMAHHVIRVEYRYQILYFILQKEKLMTIALENIPENDRQKFLERFVLWANCNKVAFSEDAALFLKDFQSME